MISVIVMVYHKEKYIRECIESILSQIDCEFELILVNDGSTDDSPRIIDEYKGNPLYNSIQNLTRQPTIVIHQENQGAMCALNTGIKASHGEYIIWLGRDDKLLPDSLSIRLNAMEDCDILYTEFNQINAEGKLLGPIRVVEMPQSAMARNMIIGNFINAATVMMKREVLDRVGLYSTETKADNDCDMWLRCLHEGYIFKHLSQVTVDYRIHPDQISSDTELMRTSKDHTRLKALNYFSPDELMSDVLTSWESVYKEMGNILFNQKLFDSARCAMELSKTANSYRPLPEPKIYINNINVMAELAEPYVNKLAIFSSGNNTFLIPITDYLSDKYEIKWFTGGTIQDMHNLMAWSDISWFEWCDNLLATALTLPKVCRIICRLHSYEAFEPIIQQLDWTKVDDLVFVAPHIRDIVRGRVAKLPQTTIIYNGVDLNKYQFVDKEKGFNIAYVGYLNNKKNIPLLLQCIKALIDIDNRYLLHIAGEWQEYRQELYWNHMVKELDLSRNIVFHGWITDVNKWLEDKHFTVSTSLLESFCYGISDAMATGCKPIIHNFVGAKELYGTKYLFNTPQEFTEKIIIGEYNPIEYHEFIEKNYNLEQQLHSIEKLLEYHG